MRKKTIGLLNNQSNNKVIKKAPQIVFMLVCVLILLGVGLYWQSRPHNEEPSQPTSLSAEKLDGTKNDSAVVEEGPTSYDDFMSDEEMELPLDAQSILDDLLDAADQAYRISAQFNHVVAQGETFTDILELSGLPAELAYRLERVDPELARLRIGQQFYWILDNNNQLEYLNWLVSQKEERVYERMADGSFKRRVLEKQSVWKKAVLKGEVTTSLNTSLIDMGLSPRQINQLSQALQWQINLRTLQKGDRFVVYVDREYIEGELTGIGNVQGIHIRTRGNSYYAIQSDNGRYYNQQGETIGRGFARYPLQRQPRISSPFNLNRLHPITKRRAPHKGVDFAVPSGTPVIAPADGVVQKVAYQPRGAGHYLVIRHGREYDTVYMHLSRVLVKPGQNIKRGDRIALSGNTGGSTGPHLHYEFHINGRAVNPMTVKLPGNNIAMDSKERKAFLNKAKTIIEKLQL